MDGTAHYEVAVRGDRVVAHVKTGPFDLDLGDGPCARGPVVLGVETGPHPHGSDAVCLGFEETTDRSRCWRRSTAATSPPR